MVASERRTPKEFLAVAGLVPVKLISPEFVIITPEFIEIPALS